MKKALIILLCVALLACFTGCFATTTTQPAAATTAETASATDSVNVSDSMGSFMGIFFLVIGVYLLYSAITGKGKIYENQYPEEIKDDVYKKTRLLTWCEAPILIFEGVIDVEFFKIEMEHTLKFWLTMGCIIAGLLLVVAYVVWLYVKYGKELKAMRKSQDKMPKF